LRVEVEGGDDEVLGYRGGHGVAMGTEVGGGWRCVETTVTPPQPREADKQWTGLEGRRPNNTRRRRAEEDGQTTKTIKGER
jgi:hypothetical protein